MDWNKPWNVGINNLDPNEVWVRDGELQLYAHRLVGDADPTSADWDCGRDLPDYLVSKRCPIRSGAIMSKPWDDAVDQTPGFAQQYGRFEVRARIDLRPGAWPAHWLLPVEGGWPDAGEIDVMEAIAERPGDVHGSFHGGTIEGDVRTHHSKGNHHEPGDRRWEAGWHVYAVEWEPLEIRYFVDDLQIGRVREGEQLNTKIIGSPNPAAIGTSVGTRPVDLPDSPFFWILNTSIVPTGGLDIATFSSIEHRIDWVRSLVACDAASTEAACVVAHNGSAKVTDAAWMSGAKWSPAYRGLSIADFDGDGADDLLLPSRGTGHSTYLLRADGRGGLRDERTVDTQFGMNAADWSVDTHVPHTLDADGDGRADLLLQARTSATSTLLLIGQADGSFVRTTPNVAGLSAADWQDDRARVVPLDQNGDGKGDLLLLTRTLNAPSWLLRADGAGGFVAQSADAGVDVSPDRAPGLAFEPLVGDFDGDGDDDLVLRGADLSQPTWFAEARGAAGFIARDITTAHGMGNTRWNAERRVAHVGDLDGDGKDDLLLQNAGIGYETLFLKGQTGGFASQADWSTLHGLTADDWSTQNVRLFLLESNGDGVYDLLLQGNTEAQATRLLRGRRTGGPLAPVDLSNRLNLSARLWSAARASAHVGDFDGDGKDDVLLRGVDENADSWLLYLAEIVP